MNKVLAKITWFRTKRLQWRISYYSPVTIHTQDLVIFHGFHENMPPSSSCPDLYIRPILYFFLLCCPYFKSQMIQLPSVLAVTHYNKKKQYMKKANTRRPNSLECANDCIWENSYAQYRLQTPRQLFLSAGQAMEIEKLPCRQSLLNSDATLLFSLTI